MAGDSPQQDGGTDGWLATGSRVAAYQIEAQAGAGGMAVVYRARDERLSRTVALKVPAPSHPGRFAQRFVVVSSLAEKSPLRTAQTPTSGLCWRGPATNQVSGACRSPSPT